MFIKLTGSSTKETIIIRSEDISDVRVGNTCNSIITTTGGNTTWQVEETVDEIFEIIQGL